MADKLTKIIVPEGATAASRTVSVSVNGHRQDIPVGVETEVSDSVLDVLNNSSIRVQRVGKGGATSPDPIGGTSVEPQVLIAEGDDGLDSAEDIYPGAPPERVGETGKLDGEGGGNTANIGNPELAAAGETQNDATRLGLQQTAAGTEPAPRKRAAAKSSTKRS